MKIITKDRNIQFMPEHDKDCFDLGCFAIQVGHILNMTSNTDKPMPKINLMEITTDELWRFITAKIL